MLRLCLSVASLVLLTSRLVCVVLLANRLSLVLPYLLWYHTLLPSAVISNQPQAQSQSHMLDEQLYDNLTKCGLDMVKILVEAGGTAEDLLFFIAAIYNSELAAAYHFTTSSEGLGIKRITSKNATECLIIAGIGRHLRDLHRLLANRDQFIAPGKFARKTLNALSPAPLLDALGVISLPTPASSLYRVVPQYELLPDFWEGVQVSIDSSQKEIDALVEDLYEF